MKELKETPERRAARYVERYGAEVFLDEPIDTAFPKEVMDDIDREFEESGKSPLLFALMCIAYGVEEKFSGLGGDFTEWNYTEKAAVMQLCNTYGVIAVDDMIIKATEEEGSLLALWWKGAVAFSALIRCKNRQLSNTPIC